jgi:glycosyltransferase involved in cell wall biosynthesis
MQANNPSDPIRLAILGTRGVPARYGGFERFAEEVGAGLATRGIDVTVICNRDPGQSAVETYRGMTLRRLASPSLGPLTTVWFDLRSLLRCLRGYDLVYMLGYGTAWAFFLPRLFGTPVLANMDGLEWRRSKWSWLGRTYLKTMESWALVTASGVIADAEAIRRDLESRHGRIRHCWTVPYGTYVAESPPPIDPLTRRSLEPGDYYTVVCRIEPENHIEEIIRGFLESGSRRRLVIVGDHNVSAYGRQLTEIGDSRLCFIGPLFDTEELLALRYHGAAYLHGHSVGGTNPSLLEALGCGNVVISHDNPFNREVLGDRGHYFRSPEDLARILRELESGARSVDERETIQKVALGRFTWTRVVDDYVKIIDEIVRG